MIQSETTKLYVDNSRNKPCGGSMIFCSNTLRIYPGTGTFTKLIKPAKSTK